MNLSTRAANILSFALERDIQPGDEFIVAQYSEQSLLFLPNCGAGTVKEIKEWLAQFGLKPGQGLPFYMVCGG